MYLFMFFIDFNKFNKFNGFIEFMLFLIVCYFIKKEADSGTWSDGHKPFGYGVDSGESTVRPTVHERMPILSSIKI